MIYLLTRNASANKGAICKIGAFHKRMEEVFMDTANIIKELRESIGMNRKEFTKHKEITIGTLEEREA